MKNPFLTMLLLVWACTGSALGQVDSPDARTAFFAQGGVAAHGAYSITAGVRLPWTWHRESHNGQWSAATEAYVSGWNSRTPEGRTTFTQVGIIPVIRYRFDQGRSNWFADGGIGLTYMDRLYRRDDKQFSTRFNFIDVVGVGFNFGDRRENELQLRLAHFSNAGIRHPNPGENFVQLRFARSF